MDLRTITNFTSSPSFSLINMGDIAAQTLIKVFVDTLTKHLPLPMIGVNTTNSHISRAHEIYQLVLKEMDENEFLTEEDKINLGAEMQKMRGLREGVITKADNTVDVKKKSWVNRHLNVAQYMKARKYEKGMKSFYNSVQSTSETRRMERIKPSEVPAVEALTNAPDDPEFHAAAAAVGLQPQDVNQFLTASGGNIYYSGTNNPAADQPTVIIQNNNYHIYTNPSRNLRRTVTTLDTPTDMSPIESAIATAITAN